MDVLRHQELLWDISDCNKDFKRVQRLGLAIGPDHQQQSLGDAGESQLSFFLKEKEKFHQNHTLLNSNVKCWV